MLAVALGARQSIIDHLLRLGLHLLRLIHQPIGEIGHVIAIRDAEGGIAMPHDEVAVAGLLPDQIDQAHGFLDIARVRVDEDSVVLETVGRGDENIGHVVAMSSRSFSSI